MHWIVQGSSGLCCVQISCNIACMWNLEKWYIRAYLQGRNRDPDIENRFLDTKWGERGWDKLGDWD